MLKSIYVIMKKEMQLPYFEQILSSNGMKILWYSACSLLSFLFRTNVKKGHLDENNFCHCYGGFI